MTVQFHKLVAIMGRVPLQGQVIRRTLHRLSRGVVLERHLPPDFGSVPMFVSPESALGYWRRDLGKVDPFLLSMARELVRPETQVWDIGANVGLFSFAAAGLGARVVAVEADVWLVHLLERSVQRNALPVTILHAAAADKAGFASLHVGTNGRSSNSLIGEGRAQTVVSITLDSLLRKFPAPDVVKIDVEGMEYAVLSGAKSVLAQKPVLLCEVTRCHEEVGQLLREAGYTLYAAREKERRPLRRPSVDTLALSSGRS